jgi:hypothetical protein
VVYCSKGIKGWWNNQIFKAKGCWTFGFLQFSMVAQAHAERKGQRLLA